jgi:Zn-finger nucleic acid-binding protein
MALFEIKCPMCKGSIWIDPSSGKVVDHRSADHHKAGLGEFLKQEKEKSAGWDDKLRRAKDDQEKHKADLEAKFRKAQENADQLTEGIDNPYKWE